MNFKNCKPTESAAAWAYGLGLIGLVTVSAAQVNAYDKDLLDPILNPTQHADTITSRAKTRFQQGDRSTTLGGGLKLYSKSDQVKAYNMSEEGWIFYVDQSWTNYGIMGRNLHNAKVTGNASASVGGDISYVVNPSQLSAALEKGLGEIAANLPEDYEISAHASDEYGIASSVGTGFGNLTQGHGQNLKNANVVHGRKKIPLKIRLRANTALEAEIKNVDLDFDVKQNELKVVFGVPIGKTGKHYVFAGAKEQVDTIFFAVKADVRCQFKADGELEITSGDTTGKIFGNARLTAHTRVGVAASEEVGPYDRRSERSLQFQTDGLEQNWMFEAGVVEFRVVNPGYGGSSNKKHLKEVETAVISQANAAGAMNVQHQSTLDYTEDFYLREETRTAQLGFVGVGHGGYRVANHRVAMHARVYEDMNFAVILGGETKVRRGGTWSLSYDELNPEDGSSLPIGKDKKVIFEINIPSKH